MEKIAPSCQRKRGDRCSFICDSNYQSWISSTSIVCTSASTWNENINTICKNLPVDRGLLIGMWNPASLVTITNIPGSHTKYIDNVTQLIQPSIIQIYSITSDDRNKVIFLAVHDVIFAIQNYTIPPKKSRSLESESVNVAFRGKSAALGQIAFDYVSNNLYWCDSLLNWIGMKPAYGHNISSYKIVVQDDLSQPEGLTLDPEDGLMFFSDNDVNPRIEKASMDGSDRTVIVHTGLLRVLSLTVDAVNNLLFWADVNRHTLEVSNYNGSNRRVVRRQSQVLLNSVVYHRNILHVVSSSARLVAGYDVTVGSLMYGVNTSKEPFTIHVYDAKTLKSHDDSCASRSCQHICVNTPTGSKCLCAEGYRLSTDGFTCKEHSSLYERGCIISNATVFTMLEVHVINGIKSIVKGIRISSANITSFAVDSKSRVIYFVDSRNNRLKKVDIITRNFQTVASIGSVTDLNFDWIANLLIWIEPTASSIQTYSINSGSTTTIYGGLPQPVSLTVDPYNGYLFWLSGKSQKSIMRGTLRRNLPEAIVSPPNLSSPTSLHYDITSKRIYWLDKTTIKSSLTDGSNIQSHSVTLGAIQIFMYKDFFGWMDENNLYFARKSKKSHEHILDMPIQNPKDVVIYDSSLQRDKNGVCNVLNGGCEDICVPIQSGRKCECDIGLKLQSDLKTCDSDVYSRNFLIVIDNSHGRILQIDINTGSVVKLPFSIKNSPGIAFDRSTKELIYSDASSKTIMSTTLHGRNKSLVYATGHAYADRLTIDFSTGNIYYSAVAPIPSQSFIGVVNRKSFQFKTLLFNLHRPKDIVLYPSRGYLYWTETGRSKEISRSFMDGTSQTYIATTNIGAPTGLAIDFTTNRLYWTDAPKDHIEYSDLNGGNRHVLSTDKDAFPMGLAVLGQYLYYIASNRQGVIKINKATGSKVTFMSSHPELGVLDSMDVYTDDSVDVSLSCSSNNGNCSTFCFPTPNGRTCGCEDGVDLLSDQTTCQGVPRCTSSLHNVNLLDCLTYPGQTCNANCKSGYRLTANVSLRCDHFGQWTPSPVSICTEILCTSAIKHVKLSSSCTRKAGVFCTFSCNDGYIPTTSESLLCTDMGVWSQDTRNLCLRNTSSQHNSEESGIYDMNFYIGSSIAGIIGIIFAVALAIACFLKRRRNTSRASYQTSVHAGHNYSIIRYRRNLAGSYREEGQEATEYVTIDDQAIIEYMEPIEDPYIYPVYSY